MKIIQDKPNDTSGYWNGMNDLALGFLLFLGNLIGFTLLTNNGIYGFLISCLIVGNVFTIRSICRSK